MDEESIEASLDVYKAQLNQVEQALQATGPNEDLEKLKSDLQELVSLTEESLLSLKKSKLLSTVEKLEADTRETTASNSKAGPENDLDDEYAAFQAALEGEVTQQHPVEKPGCSTSDIGNSDLYGDNAESKDLIYEELQGMVGMKCRAPHQHEWGSMSYHNAIICGVEKTEAMDSLPKVSVMFCYPTHTSMLPCKYHLEGSCKFSDKNCRYSHGELVNLEDLKEFVEPDHSTLKVESGCLAQYEDDLWYRATVVDVGEDHQYTVMFDSYNETLTVDIKSILPLDPTAEDKDSDSDNDVSVVSQSQISEEEDDDDEDELPVFLWRPPRTLQAIGEWECHTKGIGSKLMSKMGFIVGQGLGKTGQGRTEPVPIQLYPQGKSLDKIMELKEIAGEQDLFDVMKKREKKMKSQAKKQESVYHKMKLENTNVFDFINNKLGGKRGNLKELIPREHLRTSDKKLNRHHKQINEQDLHSKSDRTLNIQLLKTDEEMKNVRKELERLKQSLARNELRDKGMAKQVQQKIHSMEQYLEKLQSSERAINQHKEKRSNHKKLTVF